MPKREHEHETADVKVDEVTLQRLKNLAAGVDGGDAEITLSQADAQAVRALGGGGDGLDRKPARITGRELAGLVGLEGTDRAKVNDDGTVGDDEAVARTHGTRGRVVPTLRKEGESADDPVSAAKKKDARPPKT